MPPEEHRYPFTAPKSFSVQGDELCFSHIAGMKFFGVAAEDVEVAHCDTFPDAIEFLKEGIVEMAMIPVINNSAGSVPYNHKLICDSGLHVVGEIFRPIQQCLAVIPGTRLEDVEYIESHPHALDQVKKTRAKYSFKRAVNKDTAGAARDVKARGDRRYAAICPFEAAVKHKLEVLIPNAQDEELNTTQFVALARSAIKIPYVHGTPRANNFITSYQFNVGEAGPNIRILDRIAHAFNGRQLACSEPEKFTGPTFAPVSCYIDVRGHKDSKRHREAVESLIKHRYIANEEPKIIGCYPRDPFRNVINYV